MSRQDRPEATPFQSASGVLPAALQPAIVDSDHPVLLLVAFDSDDAAARVAIRLAEARAAAGKAVILADAGLRQGRLHELLGVDNLEGLADIFLFGASLDRVRTRPEGRSFDFVPTGAYVPDAAAVLESSRWGGISRTLQDRGERLFVFVPARSPGLGILSRRAAQAILIGDSRTADLAASKLDPGCTVLAVVEPPSAPEAREGVEGAAKPGGAVDAPKLSEPVVFRNERDSPRLLSPLLLVLLLAALIAAGWFLYQEYFAEGAVDTATEPASETVAETPRGQPVETPIPFSVAVEAHQDLESGMERIMDLRRAEPDVGFYLAPVAVRNVLYYRLLAGPVADHQAGERLMARLVEGEYKTAIDPWAIRPTELAFHLGEFDTEAAARARVRELAAMTVEDVDDEENPVRRPAAIPAYVVAIPYDAGPPRYRVYGGAYESEAEAEVMREMLTEAGLEPRLVPRTGAPVEEVS